MSADQNLNSVLIEGTILEPVTVHKYDTYTYHVIRLRVGKPHECEVIITSMARYAILPVLKPGDPIRIVGYLHGFDQRMTVQAQHIERLVPSATTQPPAVNDSEPQQEP